MMEDPKTIRLMLRMERLAAWTSLVLVLLQLVLLLVSWIVASAMPSSSVHSLLGTVGIRWFFGRFVDNLSSPLLVWMLLLGIGIGAFFASGLYEAMKKLLSGIRLSFRQRFSLGLVVVEVIVILVMMILLTCLPHAILLSSSGNLFPSSFSRSIVPVVAFTVMLCSLSFGVTSGRLTSVVGVYRCLITGLRFTLPLLPLYVFAAQLYHSLLFVIN